MVQHWPSLFLFNKILCVSVWNSEERDSSEVERGSKAVSFSVPSLFAV